MTLVWRPGFQFDADASTYIEAVEVADGQALETGVRYAINNFVIGCKQDGIWSAIKASCILAGARTLAGALVPLVGTAPTNYNFVAGDYNRKTGLVGNASTKYLDTNRSATADPLLNCHAASWASSGVISLGSLGGTTSGAVVIAHSNPVAGRLRNDAYILAAALNGSPPSFVGFARTLATGFTARSNGASEFLSATANNNVGIGNYATHRFAGPNYYNSRLAFYSIGEALDLAKLDGRVTDLMNAFAAAIP